MTRVGGLAVALAAVALLEACGDNPLETSSATSGWIIELPSHLPTPRVPADNPMTWAKVELGRHLFYDRRLSGNGEQSCGDCHKQSLAFSDGLKTNQGSTGQALSRNSMALVNQAYNSVYTWANPALGTLEQQILVPMFGDNPVELGMTDRTEVIKARMREDARYPALFAAAAPEDPEPVNLNTMVDALATFVRSLVSSDSPYDRHLQGFPGALSDDALQGFGLFFSEKAECHHCHGGFNLSFSSTHENSAFIEVAFHNTGLYNIGGTGDYPYPNTGIHDVTGEPTDMGRFRAPSLRNIEVTAPYMHDGSMSTLEEVVRFYEAGGRNIETGELAGDGRANPFKSSFVKGFQLSDLERQQLIAFLKSLTDPTFLTNPAYTDPFATSEP